MSKKANSIANQEPLRVINRIPYNPLIHTPPTGLEKHIILEPTIYPTRTNVRQHLLSEFKPGPDMKTNEEYGQFVELGGKRKRKSNRSKKRIRTSSRKSNRSKKSIKKRRKSITPFLRSTN